jgi:hypothetical protein
MERNIQILILKQLFDIYASKPTLTNYYKLSDQREIVRNRWPDYKKDWPN